MTVYAAEFSECFNGGSYCVISLHATKAGAYRAMRKSKLEEWEGGQMVWDYMAWQISAYHVEEI